MLEWMHDDSVVHYLSKDFSVMTIDDCRSFIINSQDNKESVHFAIASDDDEYLGTISLKDINPELHSAEFGIVIRKKAMGKGYASEAMTRILNMAKNEYGLETVYWCVDPENKRAARFYDKQNYKRVTAKELPDIHGYTSEQINRYIWYIY